MNYLAPNAFIQEDPIAKQIKTLILKQSTKLNKKSQKLNKDLAKMIDKSGQ